MSVSRQRALGDLVGSKQEPRGKSNNSAENDECKNADAHQPAPSSVGTAFRGDKVRTAFRTLEVCSSGDANRIAFVAATDVQAVACYLNSRTTSVSTWR
jgi:Tfp pilus assembly protein PilW